MNATSRIRSRIIQVLLAVGLAIGGISPTAAQTTEPSVVIVGVIPASQNTALADEDGEFHALIAVQNQTNGTVNLTGWGLSDDAAVPDKWTFPSFSLTAGSGRIIFASGKNRRPTGGDGNLHTNFTYPCDVPYAGLSVRVVLGSTVVYSVISTFEDPNPACEACEGRLLITRRSPVKYLVPQGPQFETVWMQPARSIDVEWPAGRLCMGYEAIDPGLRGDLILYATMDKEDVDYEKDTVFDVSGPTVHDGFYAGLEEPLNPPAQISEGLRLEGGESHVVFPAHSELDPGRQDFSASIWVFPAGDTADEVIVSKGGLSANNPGWIIYSTGEETRVQVIGNNVQVNVRTERLRAGEWHHLLFTIDRTDKNVIRLYRGGELVDEQSIAEIASIEAPDTPLYLAQHDALREFRFRGLLDDFAIWGRTLGEEEVLFVNKAGVEGVSFLEGGGNGGDPLFADCIDTDLEDAMHNVNSSVYIRVPFNVADRTNIGRLTMRVKYDDAFVAYLNGTPLVRRNYSGPAFPPFNAGADSDRPDEEALIYEEIDITAFAGVLVDGGNVLAIQAMNHRADDERFLFCVDVCADPRDPDGQCRVCTAGTDFWITFPGNAPTDPSNPLQLAVCVRGAPGTQLNFRQPARPGGGFQGSVLIGASGSRTIVVPPSLALGDSDVVHDNGLHLTSSAPVDVYPQSRLDYSTDSYLAVPTGLLGSEYLVLGMKNVWDGEAAPLLNGTQFAIIAAFDNTKVRITPTVETDGHPAGVPYDILLDAGETYQLRNFKDAPADLSGTEILASRPIGVFGGHRCANVDGENEFFCDYVVEQMLPLDRWGSFHATAPLRDRDAYSVRIMAAQDNTQVFINGAFAANLDRGEVHDAILDKAAEIISEGRVLVAQLAQSADVDGPNNTLGDPFMALVQPEQAWSPAYRICSPVTGGFSRNFINIVAPTSQVGLIRLDGVVIPAAEFQPMPIASSLVWLSKEVTAGPHTITSRGGFALMTYGFDVYDSYGSPGTMCFVDTSAPVISACPPELTLYCDPPPPGADLCWATLPDLRPLVDVHDAGSSPNDLAFVQQPPPGTRLQEGSYEIVITIYDRCGNSARCVVPVIVLPPWQQQHFPNDFGNPETEDKIWGWNADPDGDGKTNRDEYALGCDPNDGSDGDGGVGVTLTPLDGGAGFNGPLKMTVTFKTRPLDSSVSYFLEGGTNLEQWSPGRVGFQELVDLAQYVENGEFIQGFFEAILPATDPPPNRFFVRVRVETTEAD